MASSMLNRARMILLVLMIATSHNNGGVVTAQLAELDIAFVLDTTLSFDADLPLLKNVIGDIVNGTNDLSTDTRYALVTFEDFNRLPFGRTIDRPYRRHLALTNNTASFVTAVNARVIGHGNDEPASQINALYRVVDTGTAFKVDFRRNSTKVIVMWTDSRFHSRLNTSSNYPAPTLAQLITRLTSPTVTPPYRFVGLNRDGVTRNTPLCTTDLETVATATSSFAAGAVDCGPGGGDDIAAGGLLVCTQIGGSEEAIQQGFINIIRAAAGEVFTVEDTTTPATGIFDQICGFLPFACPVLQFLDSIFSFLGGLFGVSQL